MVSRSEKNLKSFLGGEARSLIKKKSKNSIRVFVALSGGVDSSVAAWLLKKQGYEVIGVFMHCYNVDGCAERDAEDARRVAEKLKIPFYIWDFEEEYKKKVVDYMINVYRQGLTPNPDIVCNREIKFGLFLKKALSLGANYVATGHYVVLKKENFSMHKDRSKNWLYKHRFIKQKKITSHSQYYSLWSAKDFNKDQSYFLWTLTQDQLKYCLFPIGNYLKSEVRQLAGRAELPTAEKKDSQGICFLGRVSLDEFLKKYIPPKPGSIVDQNGRVLGTHQGVFYYTIGQRHLRADWNFISGGYFYDTGRMGRKPLYVAQKDIQKNLLIVAEGSDNLALYKKEVLITNINLHQGLIKYCWSHNSQDSFAVLARVRYRQPLVSARLYVSYYKDRAKLVFVEPVKFVAPGQSAVFYSPRGELLGGGVILDSC
jgi:tRNA-specific 2-thiouridylase